MPKSAGYGPFPAELFAFLQRPLTQSLVSPKTLRALYMRSSYLINRRSRKFLLTAIPAVQRQLRWAMLLALLRTYILFMRRIILDPRSGLEKTLNKHGGWMLLMALRERFKATVRKRIGDGTGVDRVTRLDGDAGSAGQAGSTGWLTPPTSPAHSIISSGGSFSKDVAVQDWSASDPVLLAVRQVIPDATGYKVVIPQPRSIDNQEGASRELARRISGKNIETKAYYKNGILRTPTTSERGGQKVVSLVIMEDYGDRKSVKGAVTVDTRRDTKKETKKIEELEISLADALAY